MGARYPALAYAVLWVTQVRAAKLARLVRESELGSWFKIAENNCVDQHPEVAHYRHCRMFGM
jgi:hypothetical protein